MLAFHEVGFVAEASWLQEGSLKMPLILFGLRHEIHVSHQQSRRLDINRSVFRMSVDFLRFQQSHRIWEDPQLSGNHQGDFQNIRG